MIEQLTKTIDVVLSDGETYTFDKIGPNEWADFHQFMMKDGRAVSSTEIYDFADTPIGARWLLWRCLKNHTTGMSVEMVGTLVETIPDMHEILRKLVGSDPKGNPTASSHPNGSSSS